MSQQASSPVEAAAASPIKKEKEKGKLHKLRNASSVVRADKSGMICPLGQISICEPKKDEILAFTPSVDFAFNAPSAVGLPSGEKFQFCVGNLSKSDHVRVRIFITRPDQQEEKKEVVLALRKSQFKKVGEIYTFTPGAGHPDPSNEKPLTWRVRAEFTPPHPPGCKTESPWNFEEQHNVVFLITTPYQRTPELQRELEKKRAENLEKNSHFQMNVDYIVMEARSKAQKANSSDPKAFVRPIIDELIQEAGVPARDEDILTLELACKKLMIDQSK